MGVEQEAAVRAFMAGLEGEQWDSPRVERAVSRLASDARYQVHAWDDPLIGHDAIRAELLRQAPGMSDLRIEILTIGSVGRLVFTERLDSLIFNSKPLTVHIVGVFEVDSTGKIAAWRDYMDSREIAVQVGAGESGAAERTSAP
jgi:limonene-1,2-epoxide hydrolase